MLRDGEEVIGESSIIIEHVADCAAAPGLFFAMAIHAWDEGTHSQLTRYYRALAHRPSFAKVIADARAYRHLFPLPWPADFDRYH